MRDQHVAYDVFRPIFLATLEGSTIIPLCIVPHYKDVMNIKPHHAVVLRKEFYNYESSQWDLTTLRVR